jgi:hypothetical protein
MTEYKQLVISLPAHILAQVRARLDATAQRGKQRNNTSGAIAAALDRYYTILARERAALRPRFDAAICATLIALPRHYDAGLLWAQVEQVDPELGARLKKLSYAQACALVDALERWDIAPGADPAALLAEPREVTP